jgi:diguanylate cyclase (GGDEF)-like protein
LDTLQYHTDVLLNADEVAQKFHDLKPTSTKRSHNINFLKDGRALDLNSFPLMHKKQPHGCVWHFKNITGATHAPLTKLTNRRDFGEMRQQTIQQVADNDAVHALLYLDLDHFKIINDRSVHGNGDVALIEVTQLLSELLRTADTLARVGGDERCILLNNCSLWVAKQISEKTPSTTTQKKKDEMVFTFIPAQTQR